MISQLMVRALVHNPWLAARQRGLLATWDASSGCLLPQECAWLSWAQDDENSRALANSVASEAAGAATNAVRLRDEGKMFGAISCACIEVGEREGGESGRFFDTAILFFLSLTMVGLMESFL